MKTYGLNTLVEEIKYSFLREAVISMYHISLRVDFKELLTAYNVRNAVYAFGDAIDQIHTSLCGGRSRGVCDAMKTQLTGELLLEFLANVSGRSTEES